MAARAPSRSKGRVARTRGVSLLPSEVEDIAVVEELTGVGFSELYRRFFAHQVSAAANVLREAREAGVELDRAQLRDTWDVHMSAESIASIYLAESELEIGD